MNSKFKMDIVATKNDHGAQSESYCSVSDALKDKGELPLPALPNRHCFPNNTGEHGELDPATALKPLSGLRLAAVAFA